MGNSSSDLALQNSCQALELSQKDKQNLKIYLWRSSEETNQNIARVKLVYPRNNSSNSSQISCLTSRTVSFPNIVFEKYVCDFKGLNKQMSIEELFTVFRSFIKGHQSIYKKLGATLISEKCSFLTHNGQIRVWVNPNYYVNDFWEKSQKQFKLKNLSQNSIKAQTPRFMNREQFNFQKMNLLTSESTITQKIIEFMEELSNGDSVSLRFWVELRSVMQQNILKNCNFQFLHKFLNFFQYRNKIISKVNVSEFVDKLIKNAKVFRESQYVSQNQKEVINASNLAAIDISQSPNPFEANIVSILDIKNISSRNVSSNCASNKQISNKKVGEENYNFSRLLATTIHQENQNFKGNNRVQELNFSKNVLLEIKKGMHKRKLSKSLMEINDEGLFQSSNPKDGTLSVTRSQAFKKLGSPFQGVSCSNKDRSKSNFESSNLNLSYQYSINLHTNKVEKHHNFPSKESSSRKTTFKDNNVQLNSMNKLLLQQETLRVSNNSKSNGSILKNHATKQNSEQIQERITKRSFKHELLQISKQNQEYKVSMSKVNSKVKSMENSQKSDKQNLFSTFQKEPLAVKNEESQKRYFGNRSDYNSKEVTVKLQQKVFKQLQNYKESAPTTTAIKNKQRNSVTSLHYNICQFADRLRTAQNSLLVNINYIDNQTQEEIVKSKRRISLNEPNSHAFQGHNEGKLMNAQNNGLKTFKTITQLLSEDENFQTSIGSMSSESFSSSIDEDKTSKYSGILTKMGRSVQLRKQNSQYAQMLLQNKQMEASLQPQMPNFTKKKSIYDHGLNRSMKF